MIPMTRYVNITSGVGGGSGVRLRDLITRLFTNNELVPPGAQVEFTSADAVATYFGATSAEYLRAVFYFGFISKNITRPNKISFARWNDTATAPKVFGNTTLKALATFTPIAAGSLSLDLGSGVQPVTAINLTGAGSLAAVAASLQTAIRAVAAGGVAFTGATVAYDATTNRFNLVSGLAAGAGVMAVNVSGVGTDLAPLLGWTAATGAIINQGSAIQTLTACLSASAELSNNFASFMFIPVLNTAQVVEVATWNKTQNNFFMYLQGTSAANAATLSAALLGIGGVALTLSPIATEYPELVPGMVLAATDYSKANSVQNFMFQQAAPLTPSVLTAALADTYDPLRVNYYGVTQTAGQNIAFYQRGSMMGLATDPTAMNVYANELWLKDAAAAAILALLLNLKVSANLQGRSQLIAVLSTVIAQAVRNGTVSVGKTLSTVQQLYIAQITNDPRAVMQVQNLGYWLDCSMVSYVTSDGRTEWKAVYSLVYSKDDTISKVEGTHVLI